MHRQHKGKKRREGRKRHGNKEKMWSGINQARGGSGAEEARQHVLRSKHAGNAGSQLLTGGVSTGKRTSLASQGKGLTPPRGLIPHEVLALPPNTPSLLPPSRSFWERKPPVALVQMMLDGKK